MSLFAELKRRNVFRVGIAYLIVAWLVLQVADLVLENISAPEWVMQVIMLLVAIGFPLVLVFAWAFELTPEGIKRDKDVDRSASIAPKTGKKLNTTILVLLALAVAYLLYDKFSGTRPSSGSTPAADVAQSAKQPEPETAPDTLTRAERQSIAVLPFANRSNREDDLFFTDGIHDDLLTQLAKIDGLKVISRTSVMEYRGTTKKIPEIATELGVANILEGGIQRAGNRVRINAQLIDVKHDEHLWAETYDREMTIENLFDIQSDITRAIVSAVKLQLNDEQAQSLASLPTDNLEAYEALLRARASINRADYVVSKFLDALPWAEKAVELDPGFADAWATLAELHGQLYWIGEGDTEEQKTQAAAALAKTLETGAGTAAAHAAQASWHYRIERDFAAALSEYNKVQALSPADTAQMVYKALSQRRLGQWQASIETFEQILATDPANVWAAAQMADTLAFMNEYEVLSRRLDDWTLRFPDSLDLRSERVWTYLCLGQLDQAMTSIESILDGEVPISVEVATLLVWRRDYDRLLELLEARPIEDPFWQAYTLGAIYTFLDQAESARSHFSEALEVLKSGPSSSSRQEAFRLAAEADVLAFMGNNEQALATIQRAVEITPLERDQMDGGLVDQRRTKVLALVGHHEEAIDRIAETLDGPGGFCRGELRFDPTWDVLRDNPRFTALIESEEAE